MEPIKSFPVFGEPVDILVSGEMTGGSSTTMIQTSPPGGGPPPHSHRYENETFFVIDGEYEFLDDGVWRRVEPGQTVHKSPGSLHTFRNVGTTVGKMLVFVTPAGFEKYLEEISPLSMPQDLVKVLAISERFGISFPS